MNRIAHAEESASLPTSSTECPTLFDGAQFVSGRQRRQAVEPFATFRPIHYEAGYAYPLLVWLHGAGSSEQELPQLMPHVSIRNYVGVAPRGSLAHKGHSNRYRWHQSAEHIEAAETRVADCIAAAERRFNIHPERIFLAGCGVGGTMALRIAWNDPARFAGVVAMNGPLPKRQRPLHRVNDLRRVPCLLAISRDHRRYTDRQVCSDLRLLHSAGCTVGLRQYPGPHTLTDNMLADMNRWLMQLVCNGQREG